MNIHNINMKAGQNEVKVKLLSCVRLLATPWTAAYQAPPVGFSRQEYWSGLPLPSPKKKMKEPLNFIYACESKAQQVTNRCQCLFRKLWL